jgi:hypothetical protein
MVTYSDNTGSSIEDSIVISDVEDHTEGINAEYLYLGKKFGEKGTDWNLVKQSLLSEDNQYFDRIIIELKDGTNVNIYFNITEFFGKGFT